MSAKQGIGPPQDKAVDNFTELFAAIHSELGLVC